MTATAPLTLAQSERSGICDAALAAGPDAPTLCAGWNVADLLAHIVIRESRPDAAIGIVLPPARRWTESVMRGVAAEDFDQLVQRVRSGPPKWSPMAIPPVDAAANGNEFFVHHEDIRRGRGDLTPRVYDEATRAELRSLVSSRSRFLLKRGPVSISLRTSSYDVLVPATSGKPTVTVTGDVGDLLLWLHGRDVVSVELAGDPAAVAASAGLRRAI